MNERILIQSINASQRYKVPVGSKPGDITKEQQKAAMVVGRLLIHAHRRGKKRKGKWNI